MTDRCYAITDPDALTAITTAMADLFDGIREAAETSVFDVMDSFDWRLFNKGLWLFKSRGRYEAIDIATGHPAGTIMTGTEQPLRFARAFPESDFTTMLKSALDMRALLSLGTITRHTIGQDLLNSDEKIVARLALETYGIDGRPETVNQCRLMPVRGYSVEARRIVACLEQLGLQPAGKSPVLTLLTGKGLTPGAYASKIDLTLAPGMPAAEAVRCIMENLISVMQANIPGVRQDIDSEFLHDFRVAVRRARSLLSQMKGVLDAGTTATLQQRLKTMGDITGNVRDLDVALLKKEAYTALLPDVLKPGLDQLFGTLQQKRRYARNRMVKAMAGTAFNAALFDLDAFVRTDPPTGADSPGGSLPIGELAKTVIYKRYRRIVRKGSRMSDITPADHLHRLRIDCKKLRYLLEFFTSLFPDDLIKILVKQLKQLQDNLGDFNDLSVQQDFLTQHLETLRPQVILSAAATGGLITRLHTAQQQVRSQFLRVFKTFNAPENRKRFKTLFT